MNVKKSAKEKIETLRKDSTIEFTNTFLFFSPSFYWYYNALISFFFFTV